jgi:type VI secretion system protein ImpK
MATTSSTFPRDTVAPRPTRRGQLALALQEPLTAIVRLRSGKQVATDADAFRARMLRLLHGAEREALALGYARGDVRTALYAVIAFLDESVLNSSQPMFAEWPRRPMQDEVFGSHVGGEVFFQHLRQLLAREDSDDAGDVLEVYLLCMLLGFGGRYGGADSGAIDGHVSRASERIARIRGAPDPLSPDWRPPAGKVRAPVRDPWLPRLAYGTAAAAALALLLFVGYRSSLRAGVESIRTPAAQIAASR